MKNKKYHTVAKFQFPWATFYQGMTKKKSNFNFAIMNIPYLDSNIQTTPAYVFIFHNSHFTLEFVVCSHTIYNDTIC